MTLHVFNPDHDLALASNLKNFTSPHAGRQLRHDLGWIPALWAEDGSYVLTDDVAGAERAVRRRKTHDCHYVTVSQLASLPIDNIEPWGWNAALHALLLRHGVKASIMPDDDRLSDIRSLSHRRTAMQLLGMLRTDGTTGEAQECRSAEEIVSLLAEKKELVLKAPWSSSGRGVRFVSDDATSLSRHEGWIHNILERQGSVMAEPRYIRVKDFGMEFLSDGKGTAEYLGLSLFHTSNGAYTGNILATEQAKLQLLTTRYLSEGLLTEVRDNICSIMGPMLKGRYRGPFGVDMMVARDPSPTADGNELLLHPCVEINLRRTMGHVALEAEKMYNSTGDDELRHVMRINYLNKKYKLSIKRS